MQKVAQSVYILRCYGQRSIPKAIASCTELWYVCWLPWRALLPQVVRCPLRKGPSYFRQHSRFATHAAERARIACSAACVYCVLFSPVAHMQQLVAALLAVLGHHAHHDGIALGALEHCRVVGLVQTVAALFLRGLEPVWLSRAADAAALAGHDLDKMVERLALVDFFE